jgi:hypothetical protein
MALITCKWKKNDRDMMMKTQNKIIMSESTSQTTQKQIRIASSIQAQLIQYYNQINTPYIRKPDECMKITTINGKKTNISGIGEAIMKLPGGTIIRVENAIHIPIATKNLLSYKDFRNNDLHVSTATRLGKQCLLITRNGIILEKLIGLRNGLYETTIKQVTSNVEVFSSVAHWIRRNNSSDYGTKD